MASDSEHSFFNFSQFKTIADLSPLIIWCIDTEGRLIYLNPECQQFLGQPDPPAPGVNGEQFVHANDLGMYLQAYNTALAERAPFRFVGRIRAADGQYRRMAIKATPQLLADGSLFGYVAVGVDINLWAMDDPEPTEEEQALTEELAAVNEELSAVNEELLASNDELLQAQGDLQKLNSELERKVEERTYALARSEAEAQALNEALNATNEELTATNEDLLLSNEELHNSREQLQNVLNALHIAKLEVERNEKLFRSIAVNIPNSLILVVDAEHRFIAIEGDLVKKMGLDAADLSGKHPTEVLPVGNDEAVKHLYDKMFEGERCITEQASDTGMDFLVSFVPLKDERQEVYAGLIVIIDISAVKQAEKKAAHLAAIVASSDDAIVSKTLTGVVTSWNKSAERLFGYTEQEMIGEPILKLIPKDRVEEEDVILARLKQGEHVDHFETLRQAKDGRLIDVSLTISPIRDIGGNIIGASKIVRDITEQRRNELRKSDFISMVSHELKTPLTTLTAVIQLLKLKLQDSKDTFIAGASDMAHIQAKRMSNLINGFLDISRLESGKLHIEEEIFEIESLIRERIVEMSFAAPNHKINFSAEGVTLISGDREKIGSVISNLLNNATKYSQSGNPIAVHCSTDSNWVTVSVTDEGMGIDNNDLMRIFDRYYRAESVQSRNIGGFGIGLYLCAEIIRLHGGQIWAESEINKGSTFFFKLPLTSDRKAL